MNNRTSELPNCLPISSCLDSIPLCSDLDGTLIRSDLLAESVLRLIRHHPFLVFALPFWFLKGRAHLKEQITRSLPPSLTPPPVHEGVLKYLAEQKKQGRSIILVTASHEEALGPAREIFPFDKILASNGDCNLKGQRKAELLEQYFGAQGFDYIGDAHADIPVWKSARHALAVAKPAKATVLEIATGKQFSKIFPPGPSATLQQWAKGIRLHQWAKNILLAVPFIAGHHYHSFSQILVLLCAFLAMGFCASATYLWNDLLDLEYDRAHARKRHRLAASGHVPLGHIIVISMLSLIAGLLIAFSISLAYGGVLIGYIIITLAYSLFLKRLPIADICVLAFLYLARVIAGIVASGAKPSFWLFAFTFLLFLSLAAVKRYVEVRRTITDERDNVHGRGYRACDITLLSELGVGSGIASVVVLGLYTHSDQVVGLYHSPSWLWGLCVIVFYWVARIWMLTHRNEMHDDPVVFALKDPSTWIIAFMGGIFLILAGPL